ncbi:MAG: Kdo domain containing protein [Leeuwenhoekiella sp.]
MKHTVTSRFREKEKELIHLVNTIGSRGEIIYDGSRNILKNVILDDGSKVTVKCFKKPNLVNRFAYRFLRKSKAQRSFEHAQFLEKHHIGTPSPLAYFEEKQATHLAESFYICEHIDYDYTYRNLVENQAEILEWELMLRAFTRYTFEMHEAGILFKDHSPGNTLIKHNAEGFRFYLVDLNRMIFKKLDISERIQNFSRLTPRKDMVYIMADEYAKCLKSNPEKIQREMWAATEAFQQRFHRKRRLKKKLRFWKRL